jgi:hypothetical protein
MWEEAEDISPTATRWDFPFERAALPCRNALAGYTSQGHPCEALGGIPGMVGPNSSKGPHLPAHYEGYS